MTEAATTIVTFRVIEVERVRGAGRLVALAEVELDGVVLVMRGVRVMRERSDITVQLPRFRDLRTGNWIPALIVPDELGQAIARELHQILLCERRSSLEEAVARAIE